MRRSSAPARSRATSLALLALCAAAIVVGVRSLAAADYVLGFVWILTGVVWIAALTGRP